MKPDRHLHELDYIRGLGCFAVLIYHLTYRGWIRDGYSDVAYPEVGWFAPYLPIALPAFFMVSGFVMFHTVGGRDPADFALSRFSRLYPAYWACMIATTVATLTLSDGRFTVTVPQLLANLTMASNHLGQPFVDGVYWSLVVELKFYFWVFVLMLLGWLRHLDRVLAAWLLVSIPVAVGASFPLIDLLFVTEYSAYFVIGGVAHLIRQGSWTPGRVALIVGAVLLAGQTMPERIGANDVVSMTILVMVVAFLLATAVDQMTWLPRPRPVMGLAVISYPLYLLHERIGYLVMNRLAHWNRWVLLVFTIGLALGLATAAHVLVERRVSSAVRRVLASRLPTVPVRSR